MLHRLKKFKDITWKDIRDTVIYMCDTAPIALVVVLILYIPQFASIQKFFLKALREINSPNLWNIFVTAGLLYFLLLYKIKYFRIRAHRLLAGACDMGTLTFWGALFTFLTGYMMNSWQSRLTNEEIQKIALNLAILFFTNLVVYIAGVASQKR